MVHQYKNNGYNIVMDVCSGAIHVVDDVTYDVIALFEKCDLEDMKTRLTYTPDEIEEAYKHYQEGGKSSDDEMDDFDPGYDVLTGMRLEQ